jgi:hypothetical protein
MKIIKERVTQLDNEEFVHELFNDSNNINGNKLRTFRLFKTSVETVKYVKIQLPRSVRRVMAPFRSGSLPLPIRLIGAYSIYMDLRTDISTSLDGQRQRPATERGHNPTD